MPKTLTANQLVAYNLRRVRELRGLTQEMAAQELEPYLGTRWSPAVFSAAETSVHTSRVREFDANELLAFSRVFQKPIAWFFTPPDDLEHADAGAPLERSRSVSRAELLDSISGLTLYDRVVLRAQADALAQAKEALEEVLATAPQASDEVPTGTVDFARNVSDEELAELRKEERDGESEA